MYLFCLLLHTFIIQRNKYLFMVSDDVLADSDAKYWLNRNNWYLGKSTKTSMTLTVNNRQPWGQGALLTKDHQLKVSLVGARVILGMDLVNASVSPLSVGEVELGEVILVQDHDVGSCFNLEEGSRCVIH